MHWYLKEDPSAFWFGSGKADDSNSIYDTN
jgi:hypothetical protein